MVAQNRASMERQQHQHWSKQARQPPSARSRPSTRPPKAALSLSKPGAVLAIVVLGSAWCVMLVIAMTAVSGLLSPSASNGHRASGAAIIRETTTELRKNSQARLPLWLFGAIALSCAAGSMLVSRQANRPLRSRKSTKVRRLTSYAATSAPQPEFSPAPQPEFSPVPPLPTHAPPAVPSFVLRVGQMQPPSSATMPLMPPPTLMELAQQESQASTGQKGVAVTVVPSEEKHPLDWGEASLADRLAIRKRRSVSSLL